MFWGKVLCGFQASPACLSSQPGSRAQSSGGTQASCLPYVCGSTSGSERRPPWGSGLGSVTWELSSWGHGNRHYVAVLLGSSMRAPVYSTDHGHSYSATAGHVRGVLALSVCTSSLCPKHAASLLQETPPCGAHDTGLRGVPAKLMSTRNVRMGPYLEIRSL